jgi:hypothetical protein
MACHPTPTLSVFSLPCSCSQSSVPCPIPPFSEAGLSFHYAPTVSGKLQFTVYAFQFCLVGIQSAHELCWILFLWGFMWYMALTCWICRLTQAALEPGWQGEMAGGFFQSGHSLGKSSAWWGVTSLSKD